jgi:hypothetical protein
MAAVRFLLTWSGRRGTVNAGSVPNDRYD